MYMTFLSALVRRLREMEYIFRLAEIVQYKSILQIFVNLGLVDVSVMC